MVSLLPHVILLMELVHVTWLWNRLALMIHVQRVITLCLTFIFLVVQVQWLRASGFAGWAAWALDLDDFSGMFCGNGTYPLINTLNTALYDSDVDLSKSSKRWVNGKKEDSQNS